MKALILFLLVPFGIFAAYASETGPINDLLIDGKDVYFFETDVTIKSNAWIPDTRIKSMYDGRNLSEKLFIYPTELKTDETHLYFAVLSESCIGQITCDYQDIIKMSKDGNFQVLAKDLKSAIHLWPTEEFVYVSESNGKIWKIAQNGSKKLVVESGNIIMDLAVNADMIYWIEELTDQNSTVFGIKEGSTPKPIVEGLLIPYDITVQDGKVFWNEIFVKPTKETFAEFTAIWSYDDHNPKPIMEFQNTSPVSVILKEPSYGPYLITGNYLVLVNNTNDESTIQMLEIYGVNRYDIGTLNYDAKYIRADGNTLYVIGKDKAGFMMDRYDLPVTVPEFPFVFLVAIIASTSVIILQKFSQS